MVAVIAFEDLVVGVAAHLVVVVDEAGVDGDEFPLEVGMQLVVMLDVVQDGLDAVELLGTLRVENDAVAFLLLVVDVFNQEVEVLVENRLRGGVEIEN